VRATFFASKLLAVLPSPGGDGKSINMKAELIARERLWLADGVKVEIVVWRLPRALPGSQHRFKYRLALVSHGLCVLRYDNEAGKGDHKHVDEREVPYRFIDLDTLQADFKADVETWIAGR